MSLKSAFYTPFLLTAERFLPDEGVSVDLVFRSNENPSAMLQAGELDFAQMAPSAAMVDHTNGVANPPLHIASINERDGFLLIGRAPEPDFKWHDLEGKTIVPASFAAQPEACLRYALHLKNVDASKITLVGGLQGMAAAADAFRSGQGDYVHLQDPMARELVHAGEGHLIASVGDAIGPIAFSSVITSQATINNHPERVTTFMGAYSRCLTWINSASTEQIVEAITPWFNTIHPDVLNDAVDGYRNLGCWSTKTAIGRDAFERTADMMLLTPELTGVTERFDYDICCNDEFARVVDTA